MQCAKCPTCNAKAALLLDVVAFLPIWNGPRMVNIGKCLNGHEHVRFGSGTVWTLHTGIAHIDGVPVPLRVGIEPLGTKRPQSKWPVVIVDSAPTLSDAYRRRWLPCQYN